MHRRSAAYCRVQKSPRRATKTNAAAKDSTSNAKSKSTANNTLNPANHFFHQEYIESLTSFGELRVIAARSVNADLPDGAGARISDTGEIIDVALTQPQPGNPAGILSGTSRNFHGGNVFASIIPDRASQEVKYKELVAFVSAWYKALLHYSRFHPGYESLQCGVRLDIGMSESSADGKFWVLEATRLTSASSYGQGWCSEASSAWGEAIGVMVSHSIAQSAKRRLECELGAVVKGRGKSE